MTMIIIMIIMMTMIIIIIVMLEDVNVMGRGKESFALIKLEDLAV